MYYQSVGRGCNLIINGNIDRDGLVPQADLHRLREFGDEIRRRFGQSIAETSGRGPIVELALAKPTVIDHAIIMEQIDAGQRLRRYVIEGLVGRQWIAVSRGQSIGHKRIERFAPVEATKIRLRTTESVAEPHDPQVGRLPRRVAAAVPLRTLRPEDIMITGVHHVSFEVSDMERALRFYGEALGFEILSDRTISGPTPEKVTQLPGAEQHIVHLRGHGIGLELIHFNAPAGAPGRRGCAIRAAPISASWWMTWMPKWSGSRSWASASCPRR